LNAIDIHAAVSLRPRSRAHRPWRSRRLRGRVRWLLLFDQLIKEWSLVAPA
jgi:hypothetical protein